MSKLDTRIAMGRNRHGERYSTASLDAVGPGIRDAFNSGRRIRVTDDTGFTRTGTVGMTTGWVPAFLLIHRSNASGSWDVLGPLDRVVATWNGRRYVDVV